jgi:two-component system sensor histidine kinase CpxA
MGRDFNQMAERIESLIQAQQQLLGDISHELRTPLARLNVALGLARRKANPEVAPLHDRIQREADQLNEMIGELLTLTELETGAENLQTETVALDGLLNEIIADADFEARSQQRHVVLAAATACRLNGNRKLLRSALENVIRNAIRYTAPDTTVEVQLKEQGTQATIQIRDHGPGVPPEMLSHIFRPFYRVADARDRQSGGTGLGLAITERAIRLHHGEVNARNAPDGGLLVSLTLPCVI